MDALKAQLQQVDRAKLRHILIKHFNEEELRDLCSDLDIAYDALPGQCMSGKARELVAYGMRHELWAELVAAVYNARPQAKWPFTMTQDTPHIAAEHSQARVVYTVINAPSISQDYSDRYWINQTTTVAWRY
jgi:hypothetical protein